MKGNLGVKKGSWAQEEDVLLRKCIDKYGEGNWHQVPLRAGLNRCRRSCRLRWLNYLRPNIKRGDFASDEVDLIFRLHKLLGNRWSLIAGRLPGRTANDVKNYWNSHMQKKLMAPPKEPKPKDKKTSTTDQATTVTKPRPRTFSKNVQWRREETSIGNNAIMIQPKASHVSEPSLTLMSNSMLTDDDQATTVIKPRPRTFSKNVQWWVREETSIGNNKIMIKPKESCVSEPTPTLMSDSMLTDDYRADVNLQWRWSSLLLAADKEEIGANIWKDEISPTKAQAREASIMQEEGLEDWSDLSLDHDFWSFLNSGDQV